MPIPRKLFAVSRLANSPNDVADYLDHLASEIRNGNLSVERAVFISSDVNGATSLIPFGKWIDNAGVVGLVEMAKIKFTFED